MKRVGFYRRPQQDTPSGYKERIVWQLSKGPMTGRQIRELLKLETSQFWGAIYDAMKGGKVVSIERYDRHLTADGEDWWYRLTGKPKFIAPAAHQTSQQIVVTPRKREHDPQECRRINIERAARRARLIKAGLYIDEFN